MNEQIQEIQSDYDEISKPTHYAEGRKFEPVKVIRDWKLSFNLGNALKYISRAGRKGDGINDTLKDLYKAKQYIDFEIDALIEETKEHTGNQER